MNQIAPISNQPAHVNAQTDINPLVTSKGVGRSTIYEMMDENSPYYDPSFPKKVKITQNRIGWSAYEIHQWIESKLASRE
ncbi:helix-turn-helix transcriptional regulator [Acinetobacter ursingii]|uniref:helix-turn-helix transcriptional regulator n=1 Tax=Acinetobacter ursingii TaxID=108980 RepID=UPI0031F2F568